MTTESVLATLLFPSYQEYCDSISLFTQGVLRWNSRKEGNI